MDNAVETLEQIAKDNGRPMLLGRLVVDAPAGPRGSVKALLSPTLRRTTLLLWFIWYESVLFPPTGRLSLIFVMQLQDVMRILLLWPGINVN